MLELSSLRKNKVSLPDYDYEQDIRNRMVMADFSMCDIEVLEEILYSPLKISIKKLSRNLGYSEEELRDTFKRLSDVGLFEKKDEHLYVDKEKRKYFEFEINRFDPDFKPDMEFLQGLFRKVPIHILPTWYSIPRTSNNIFESIVEKYLITPQIYQRYLMELNLGNPMIDAIINDVLSSEDLKVTSSDLISKYNLKREDFEEIMLLLEFNFALCVVFEKQDDHWIEYVAPFYEWSEYLSFFKSTQAPSIDTPVQEKGSSDFFFIEKMSDLIEKASKTPIEVDTSPYIVKLVLLKFGQFHEGIFTASDTGISWLDQSLENRALSLYRHPQNRILSKDIHERHIREAEKSIKRALHGKWVYFDDFIKGVTVPFNPDSAVTLRRVGKNWKYQIPEYGEEEIEILKTTIFEWLFELGMVRIGESQGKDCFKVTPFGKFFFSD